MPGRDTAHKHWRLAVRIDQEFRYIQVPRSDLRRVGGGAQRQNGKKKMLDFLWKHLKWFRLRLASRGCLRINVSAGFNNSWPSLSPDQEKMILSRHCSPLKGELYPTWQQLYTQATQLAARGPNLAQKQPQSGHTGKHESDIGIEPQIKCMAVASKWAISLHSCLCWQLHLCVGTHVYTCSRAQTCLVT